MSESFGLSIANESEDKKFNYSIGSQFTKDDFSLSPTLSYKLNNEVTCVGTLSGSLSGRVFASIGL